jgi:hypothetical protein
MYLSAEFMAGKVNTFVIWPVVRETPEKISKQLASLKVL